MARLIRVVTVLTVWIAPCLLLAQDQPKDKPRPAKATRPAAKPAEAVKPKLTDEQKQALDILEVSEAASRGLEPPMRSYALLQIASSFPTPDEKRSRTLLRDAFTSSLEIHDDDETKARIQEDILTALLPLSLADVEELLAQAEPKVRKQTSESIIALYTDKKQFEKAIDLVNQLTAWDEFPYRSGGKLMDAMPAEMMAEKQGLFIQAVNSYKNHEHPGLQIGNSLTDVLLRHSASMPPKLVLQAIEDVLNQSKNKDEKDQRSITLGGDGGTASFKSDYEYQLFALLPLIRKLDESRAAGLLEENQALQALMQKFPLGTESITPPPKEPPKSDQPGQPRPVSQRVMTSMSSTDKRNTAMAAQQVAAEQARQRMQEVVELAEKDPAQALAQTTTLPLTVGDMPMSPRGAALQMIARRSLKQNPSVTVQALSELRKVVPDLPLGTQSPSLQTAAKLYLELGDTDSAAKVVTEGFKVADKLLEKDLDPEDPNKALKAWWPSADAYRRFVEVQTKISQRDTVNVLKEIKDPEIRTVESIMYARALLGLPMKRTTIVEKRKGMNRTSMTSGD